MTLPEQMTVGVIGAGAVGTAMAALLQNVGHEIGGISTRTRDSLERSLDFLDLKEATGHTNPGPWCRSVDLLFLTAPDDRISSIASTLSDQKLLSENTVSIHCSGAHTARSLIGPIEHLKQNRRIGSFHPLQTVPDPETGVRTIPDAWIGIEGRSDVVSDLNSLAEDIGANPFEIAGEDKTLYHLAAVFACNHVTALLSIAQRIMDEVTEDLDDPIAPLAPLIEHSIKNTLDSTPSDALTGPAVRGDLDTIESHLDALDQFDEERSDLYVELTRCCFQIAVDRGDLTAEEMNLFLSRIR